MDTKLVSENDKSFTIAANGKEIIIAKTPGAQKLLTALKAKGATVVPAGKIPGKSKVSGDSPANDTVDIKASPGEGIIPREAMQSPEAAIEFVKRMFANKESGGMKMNKGGKVDDTQYMFKGGKMCYADGGQVVDPEEAKKAAESMRKAFHFALGGVVPEKKDDKEPDEDEDDGIDEPININGTYAEGGVVKEEDDEEDSEPMKSAPVTGGYSNGGKVKGYFNAGVVQPDDPTQMQLPGTESLTDPVAAAMAPAAAAAPPPNPAFTQPGPTNVNYVAPPQTADQAGKALTSPNQTLPNGATDPLASTSENPATKMKDVTTDQTHGMLGGDKKEVVKTREELAKATEKVGEVKAALEDKQLAEVKRYTNEVNQKNDELETNRIFRQTQIDNKLDEVDKTRQKYLSMKIDPAHLWGDEGTGNRLMAAAGIILGGFGQAFNGKDNGAIQIVDNALKRDLEIQKANIAKGGDNLDAQTNMYKEFKDKLGDEAMAEKATLATMKERYANQLDLIAKSAGSEQTRAAAAEASAKIRADGAMDMGKVGGYVHTDVQQEETGKKLDMASPDVQKKYNELNHDYNGLVTLRQKYDAIKDKAGPFDVRANQFLRLIGQDDPDVSDLEGAVMRGVAELTHRMSGTGSSEKEVQRLKSTYPDLTTNPKTFQRMLDTEMNNTKQEISDTEKAYSGKASLPNRTVKKDYGATPAN